MYGIFAYIYHENQPNVGKYTLHGWYGITKKPTNRLKGQFSSMFLLRESPKWGRPRHLKECHHGLQWLHARTRWLWWEGPEWVSGGGGEGKQKKTRHWIYIHSLKLAANAPPANWWVVQMTHFLLGANAAYIFSAFSLLLVSGRVNHRGGWVTLKFKEKRNKIQNVQITKVQLSWVSWLGLLDPFFFMFCFWGGDVDM